MFTLKMASLATVPPSTTWPVLFNYGSDATGAPQQWFVAMKTDPLRNGHLSLRHR